MDLSGVLCLRSASHLEPIVMRTNGLVLLIAVCLTPTLLFGQLPIPLPSREPAIVERGPHHRVWHTVVEHKGPDGKTILFTNSYTELGTLLHYEEDGQFLETRELIEI